MRHTSKGKGRAIARGAVAVALFVVVAERPSMRLTAQSAAVSSAIPDLTAIWHRKGPFDGTRNPPTVPTNRAADSRKRSIR